MHAPPLLPTLPFLPFLIATLTTFTTPASATTPCAACGGNLFKNDREISTGYLLQVAGQLDINVLSPSCVRGEDLYSTVVERGGGMCVVSPGEGCEATGPVYACFDESTVKKPTNVTTSSRTKCASSTTRR